MTDEPKGEQFTDFGWANSWWETPELVRRCKELRHKCSDRDVGPPHRGLEHVVKCAECRYVYRYDSSD